MNNTISLHNLICVSSYPVVPLSWLEGIRLSVGQLGGYGAIEYDSIYSSEDEKNGAFDYQGDQLDGFPLAHSLCDYTKGVT
jgi:hypothetical protein